MASLTQYRTYGIASLTLGANTYTGLVGMDVNIPGGFTHIKSDNQRYPSDVVFESDLVTIDVRGVMLSATGATTLSNEIGVENTIMTFKIVSRDATNVRMTVTLVTNAKAIVGPLRQTSQQSGFGSEGFSIACFISTGVIPISITFAAT